MKKFLAICLAVLMLMSAACAESAWPEGLSAQKPYTGSPEVDFNESIGYMLLVPLNGKSILPGKVVLQICMPRDDVEVGAGTLSLYDSENVLVEEVEINAETMVVRPLTEEEKAALIWGGGVAFEVAIEQQLDANKQYYVTMTEGCVVSSFYGTSLAAIEDKSVWSFKTEAASFIEEMAYCRMVEGAEEPETVEAVQVGDMVKVALVIEEGAAAAVFCNAGAVKTDVTYFQESTEAIIEFPVGGETVWGIVFFDAEGAPLYTMEYTTEVAEPAE